MTVSSYDRNDMHLQSQTLWGAYFLWQKRIKLKETDRKNFPEDKRNEFGTKPNSSDNLIFNFV